MNSFKFVARVSILVILTLLVLIGLLMSGLPGALSMLVSSGLFVFGFVLMKPSLEALRTSR